MRQSARRRAKNLLVKNRVKEAMKNVLKLVQAGKVTEVQSEINKAYSLIDKAAKRNIFHSNTAARKKSRLALALARGGAKK